MSVGLSDILEGYNRERKSLIPVLQKAQEKLGYLSEEAVAEIARFLRLSESEIYGVASFYAQFRFQRPGEHALKICMGTACHVRGGPRIMEAIERELDIQSGQTTADYKFSLESVACFGSCALAPVMVVDKKVYGRMTAAKAREVIKKY